jgi:hypothetical protein
MTLFERKLLTSSIGATEILLVPRPVNVPPLPYEIYVGSWDADARVRTWVWQASTYGCVLHDLDSPRRQLLCFALNVLTILAAPCAWEPAIEAERDGYIDFERRAA